MAATILWYGAKVYIGIITGATAAAAVTFEDLTVSGGAAMLAAINPMLAVQTVWQQRAPTNGKVGFVVGGVVGFYAPDAIYYHGGDILEAVVGRP